jgi:hypothetical protein
MWWNVFRIFTAFNMFLLAYCTSISQRCQCPLCAPVIVAPNDGSMSTLYLFGHKPVCLTNITNMSGELDSVHPCRKLGKNTTSTTSGRLNLQNKGDWWAHKHTACAHRNNSVYMQSTTQTNKDSRDPKCKACWPSQFMICTHDSGYRSCGAQIHRDRLGTSLMFSLRSMLHAIASIFCSGAKDDE